MHPSQPRLYIDIDFFPFKQIERKKKKQEMCQATRADHGDQRHLTGWISCADPSSDGSRLAGEAESPLPSSSGMPTWHLPRATSTFLFASFMVTFSATSPIVAVESGLLVHRKRRKKIHLLRKSNFPLLIRKPDV